jgi:hypothetical protein
MTGLNDTQKAAVVMEGTPDVLNEGYQRGVWGKDIRNGDTVVINGQTFTYSTTKNLWISQNGTPWGAKNLKGYQDRVAANAAKAAQAEKTPADPNMYHGEYGIY